jgi:hypothetical protein
MGAAAQAAEGPPIHFLASLSADEESATVDSRGSGRAEFTLDRDSLRFSWHVSYKDLTSAPTLAAVHGPQRPGTDAVVLFEMGSKAQAKPPIDGSVVLSDAQLQYLLSGRLYVNIHTAKYPNGELRGQIERIANVTQ